MTASLRATILDRVKGIICKDRNSSYGEADVSFAAIAAYWQVYLEQRNPDKAIVINAEDVALMLDLMKTARLGFNQLHMDSWDDKIGYSACGAAIAQNDKDIADSFFNPQSAAPQSEETVMLAGRQVDKQAYEKAKRALDKYNRVPLRLAKINDPHSDVWRIEGIEWYCARINPIEGTGS